MKTEVTDRSYELTFEIENLKRELTTANEKLQKQHDIGTICFCCYLVVSLYILRALSFACPLSFDCLTLSDLRTVREELRGEYEGIVKDLTLQIQTLHSNFAEYKTHLYQDVLSSLVPLLLLFIVCFCRFSDRLLFVCVSGYSMMSAKKLWRKWLKTAQRPLSSNAR